LAEVITNPWQFAQDIPSIVIFCPVPSMVVAKPSLRVGSWLKGVIVALEMVKVIVSASPLLLAVVIASLKEPAPLSALVVT